MDFLTHAFEGLTWHQLVLWERPVATGVTVGGISLIFFLLGWMEYTLFLLGCRIFQLLTVIFFVLQQIGRGPSITRATIQSHITSFLAIVEPQAVEFINFLYDIISWRDKMITVKVLAASFTACFIGSFFDDLTIAFMVAVAVFAWPPVYARHHELIDQYLNMAKTKVVEAAVNIPALNKLSGASPSASPDTKEKKDQ